MITVPYSLRGFFWALIIILNILPLIIYSQPFSREAKKDFEIFLDIVNNKIDPQTCNNPSILPDVGVFKQYLTGFVYSDTVYENDGSVFYLGNFSKKYKNFRKTYQQNIYVEKSEQPKKTCVIAFDPGGYKYLKKQYLEKICRRRSGIQCEVKENSSLYSSQGVWVINGKRVYFVANCPYKELKKLPEYNTVINSFSMNSKFEFPLVYGRHPRSNIFTLSLSTALEKLNKLSKLDSISLANQEINDSTLRNFYENREALGNYIFKEAGLSPRSQISIKRSSATDLVEAIEVTIPVDSLDLLNTVNTKRRAVNTFKYYIEESILNNEFEFAIYKLEEFLQLADLTSHVLKQKATNIDGIHVRVVYYFPEIRIRLY